MDDFQKELDEEKAVADSKEEEVRASVVTKYGLDEVDDAALVEQLTKDLVERNKQFADAIKRRKTWREKALNHEEELKKKPQPPSFNEDELLSKAEERVIAKIEEREFEGLELPDDIKNEAKLIAKAKGVSLKSALQEPYLKFKMDEAVKEGKLTEAAMSRTNRTAAIEKKEPTLAERMLKYDMNTEEGRKQWVEDSKKNPVQTYITKSI